MTRDYESQRPRFSRRNVLLRLGLGTAATLGGGAAAYGTLWEPHHPVVEHVNVPIADLPTPFDGLKIVQLSDLHVQPAFPASDLAPAIRLAQAENPDLILITGDYINDDVDDGPKYMRECVDALAGLHAPLGVFVSFGNHDFPPPPGDPSRAPWIAAGMHPLLDEVATIRKCGASISVIGLRSFVKRPVDPAEILRQAPADGVRIVLWHEPDRAQECATEGASLQLSGHTHGGQVVIPLIGPPILPSGGRLYPSGLYHVGGMPLYVSRGVGLLSPRIRLNCPPEVTLLTLHRA